MSNTGHIFDRIHESNADNNTETIWTVIHKSTKIKKYVTSIKSLLNSQYSYEEYAPVKQLLTQIN